ncbi:vWA domain-containing protein [Hanstruepera ponticola]|uniref:hypothetical protein n=1 Tax=Hanstruepera ponticola TaxID=2042995 RepID=UPI001786729D|nr:hypothetical protein [Hanstruepera ponticola]
MKSLATMVFLFVLANNFAQQKNIETKSVLLNDFISFIADNYSVSNLDATETPKKINNLVFLIESNRNNPSQEAIITLKQSFRFLSKRLSDNDQISLIAYSGLNGLFLSQSSSKQLKKILNALDDIKSHVEKDCQDGISRGYEYSNEIYDPSANNIVIMIRNPNSSNYTENDISTTHNYPENKTKKGGGAIVLTAITLLPELIAVIKD